MNPGGRGVAGKGRRDEVCVCVCLSLARRKLSKPLWQRQREKEPCVCVCVTKNYCLRVHAPHARAHLYFASKVT